MFNSPIPPERRSKGGYILPRYAYNLSRVVGGRLMKKLSLALTFLAALPLAAIAQVSKEDLKKLAAAGISDDVILSYVRANGGVARLSADDVIELENARALFPPRRRSGSGRPNGPGQSRCRG